MRVTFTTTIDETDPGDPADLDNLVDALWDVATAHGAYDHGGFSGPDDGGDRDD